MVAMYVVTHLLNLVHKVATETFINRNLNFKGGGYLNTLEPPYPYAPEKTVVSGLKQYVQAMFQ